MKPKRVPSERFDIEPECQWPQLFPWRKFNWRTFTLACADFELSHIEGACLLELYLLGFGLRIRFVYDQGRAEISMREQFEAAVREKFGDKVKIVDPLDLLKKLDEEDKEDDVQ